MKQKFIHFLKENNAYEKFMYNFEHRKEIHCWFPKISAKKYFDETYEEHLLFCAFSWSYTNEKPYFWEVLNQKWINILHKK